MQMSCKMLPIVSVACCLAHFFFSSSACSDFHFPPSDFLCVDPVGCCNFTTVQAAVDAVPMNSATRSIVWINTGTYFEKVTIPPNKPNITFQGQGLNSTAIVYNNTAKTTHGTVYSASVDVFAAGFIAKNISFKNSAPAPKPGDQDAQAVAVNIRGDQAAFWGCGFFGTQDTLLDDNGRHYFKECFIQGSVDFIFGNARSLYENCILNSIAQAEPQGQELINAAITAQGRQFAANDTGFSFVNCTIQGTGRILLGRAWRHYSRVVFAYTYMPDIISRQGWSDWDDPSRDSTIFFGEFKCTGKGAKSTGRVSYAMQLTEEQVQRYLNESYIDGDQWIKPFEA